MKTWEALKALEEGKKVRLKYWGCDRYIYKTEDGTILDNTEDIVFITLGTEIKDDNWEEYGWNQTEEKTKIVRQMRCPYCFTYSCREVTDVHFIYCPHCGSKVIK